MVSTIAPVEPSRFVVFDYLGIPATFSLIKFIHASSIALVKFRGSMESGSGVSPFSITHVSSLGNVHTLDLCFCSERENLIN